jgi:hypothetical protein
LAAERKRQGYLKCIDLEHLQGNLLSEYHVSSNKAPFGKKAPAQYRMTRLVQLRHIHNATIVDAVRSAGIAPDNIEVLVGVELLALRGRKPVSQETSATRPGSIEVTTISIPRTLGVMAYSPYLAK